MNTEEKILEAARTVFTQKGYAAARMQEIADVAEINKGLLHYYFRSKERLFHAVFEEAFGRVVKHVNHIFESNLPLFEKIEGFVEKYMDTLLENPEVPAFVVNELNQKGEAFVKELMQKRQKPNPMPLIMQIQMEVDAGKIRQVNPFQLVLSLLSMCAFPFIARPLFKSFAQIDDRMYMQLMESRKKEIVDLVINGIKL